MSEASKTGFGGRALWYVFPPQKIARYVLPPYFSRFPILRSVLEIAFEKVLRRVLIEGVLQC